LHELTTPTHKIFCNFIAEGLSQTLEGAKMPRKHRAKGVLQLLGDLLETQPSHMPQMNHLLVSFGQALHSRPEGCSRVRIDLIVARTILTPSLEYRTKDLGSHRDRLPLSAAHLISKAIHGDSEQPRAKFPLVDV
jgi:hypothetical protein